MLISLRKTYWFAVALVSSLLLHLVVSVPVFWETWQDIYEEIKARIEHMQHPAEPLEVLERKKAKAVPKVSLNFGNEAAAAHKAGMITVRLISDEPLALPKPAPTLTASPSSKHSYTPLAPHATSKESTFNKKQDDLYDTLIDSSAISTAAAEHVDPLDDPEDQPPKYDLNNTLVDNTTVHVEPSSSPAAASGAAAVSTTGMNSHAGNNSAAKLNANTSPTFPIDMKATYRAMVANFVGVTLKREWHMEGHHYSIVDKGRADILGITGGINSDGEVTSEGLRPDISTIYFMGNLWGEVKFDHKNKIVTYGKPSNPKQKPMNDNIQDFSSIGFHLAMSFTDKPQDIQLALPTGIYTMHFELLNEETLKLPVGRVRTLHIHGTNSQDPNITADVWLAPDYRNMPVVVKANAGYSIEMRLTSLSLDSAVIFGKLHHAGDQADQPSASTPASSPIDPKQLMKEIQSGP